MQGRRHVNIGTSSFPQIRKSGLYCIKGSNLTDKVNIFVLTGCMDADRIDMNDRLESILGQSRNSGQEVASCACNSKQCYGLKTCAKNEKCIPQITKSILPNLLIVLATASRSCSGSLTSAFAGMQVLPVAFESSSADFPRRSELGPERFRTLTSVWHFVWVPTFFPQLLHSRRVASVNCSLTRVHKQVDYTYHRFGHTLANTGSTSCAKQYLSTKDIIFEYGRWVDHFCYISVWGHGGIVLASDWQTHYRKGTTHSR